MCTINLYVDNLPGFKALSARSHESHSLKNIVSFMVILIPYQLMGFSTTSAFPSLELRADFLFAALCLRVKYASINLLGHSQGTN